jgi:type II secretory pathway pseudopilin PulG
MIAVRRPTSTIGDSGLGLVEVVVSMLILSIVLLALLPVQVNALKGVTLAEERQQATGYANEAVERVRAQALTATGARAVAAGRTPTSADVVDAANAPCTSPTSCQFRPSFAPSFPPEALRTPPSTPDPSLATRWCSEASGCLTTATATGLTFTTRLYVSATGTADLYWVTAVTAWTSPNSSAGIRQVAVRTQIAAP